MNKSLFGFEKPEASPGFLLWQTMTTWQRMIKKALEPYQISHPQFVIMAIAFWFESQKKEARQIEIIQKSKLDKMTVSKSLKKLVLEGYVKREEHSKDTRAKTVSLTAKGKSLLKKLIPLVESIDDQFFSVLKKSEQQELMRFLNTLTRDQKDESASPKKT